MCACAHMRIYIYIYIYIYICIYVFFFFFFFFSLTFSTFMRVSITLFWLERSYLKLWLVSLVLILGTTLMTLSQTNLSLINICIYAQNRVCVSKIHCRHTYSEECVQHEWRDMYAPTYADN